MEVFGRCCILSWGNVGKLRGQLCSYGKKRWWRDYQGCLQEKNREELWNLRETDIRKKHSRMQMILILTFFICHLFLSERQVNWSLLVMLELVLIFLGIKWRLPGSLIFQQEGLVCQQSILSLMRSVRPEVSQSKPVNAVMSLIDGWDHRLHFFSSCFLSFFLEEPELEEE